MKDKKGMFSEENLMIKINGIKEIITSMGMLFVELDTSGKIIEINGITSDILGYTSEELVGKNWFDVAIPEDERDKIAMIHKRILKGNELKFEEAENDVVSLKYKRKTIHWRNLLICDESGSVKRIVSFGEDVTESRVSENIFRMLAERKPLETLDAILPILKKFLYFDRVTLGVTVSENSFKVISKITTPNVEKSFEAVFEKIHKVDELSGEEMKTDELVKDVLKRGKSKYIPETSKSPFSEDRTMAEYGWHSRYVVPLVSTAKMKIFLAFASRNPNSFGKRDITFIEKMRPSLASVIETWYFEEELTRLATIDILTEVFNRHSIQQILKNEMSRSIRAEKNFSVSMIDIDRFKHFNDTYGHDAGDVVLKKFAQTVKANLREYDVFGRYGGDEFVLIFPNTSGNMAVKIVSRLAKIISSDDIFPEEKVEFSAGVAEFKERDTEETILKRADNALYKAKRSPDQKVVLIER